MSKEILIALARIEAKQDAILMVLQGRSESRVPSSELPKMTTKQHAALQMLLGGASNADIADRFGVTDNTAKVYVRTIAAKLGVSTRSQIVIKAKPAFDAVTPEDYRILSGGLPKDWHQRFKKPDPHKHLYYGGE